jgi:hypothetical protein
MAAVGDPYKSIIFGPWVLRVDAIETSQCYRRLKETQPAMPTACECDPCRNFALVQDEAYPANIVRLFDDLGIDRHQPFELSHYSRMPSGLHLYGGWHYFCGSIDDGPTSLNAVQRVNPKFEVALRRVSEPRQPFPRSACVQLDFYTEVPWRLVSEEQE